MPFLICIGSCVISLRRPLVWRRNGWERGHPCPLSAVRHEYEATIPFKLESVERLSRAFGTRRARMPALPALASYSCKLMTHEPLYFQIVFRQRLSPQLFKFKEK